VLLLGIIETCAGSLIPQILFTTGEFTNDGIAEFQLHLPNVGIVTKHDENRPAHDAEVQGDIDINVPAANADGAPESH